MDRETGNVSVKGGETYTLGLAKTQENLKVAMLENSVILLEENYRQRYEGFDPNSSESYRCVLSISGTRHAARRHKRPT